MTVYFVKAGEHVKIGYSSKPMDRVAGLQTANPYALEVLFFMPGNLIVEKEFHDAFSQYHEFNEWYRFEGELVSFIEAASMVFAEYTDRLKSKVPHVNDKDWRYWKNRALKAESSLGPSQKNSRSIQLTGTRKLVYDETKRNPNATQQEIAELLEENHGVTISRQMVGKHQKALNGHLA